MIWESQVTCAACSLDSGDHLINAMSEWCDVNPVLHCDEKGWCLDDGCYCPEFCDVDSRVNNTYVDTIYSMVVMDYFTNALHGVDLSAEQLQCISESLVTLPAITQNNTRDQIQNHVLSSLFEKGAQDDVFDEIKEALTNPIFNYNAVFVIENMLATQVALEQAGQSADISGWDLSVIDWTISGMNKDSELSPQYQSAILDGYLGNPVKSDVESAFSEIWTEASGFIECGETAQQASVHWTCPDVISAANPTQAVCGEPAISIETVCIAPGHESWSWPSGLMGAWSMRWFQDQLAKYEPSLSGAAQDRV